MDKKKGSTILLGDEARKEFEKALYQEIIEPKEVCHRCNSKDIAKTDGQGKDWCWKCLGIPKE